MLVSPAGRVGSTVAQNSYLNTDQGTSGRSLHVLPTYVEVFSQ